MVAATDGFVAGGRFDSSGRQYVVLDGGANPANRVARVLYLDSFQTTQVAEALMTLQSSAANGAPAGVTSYNVPAGKTFRLQQIVGSLFAPTGNTTPASAILRLRANPAGAAIISSSQQLVFTIPGQATPGQGAQVSTNIADSWEFAAGTGIGATIAVPGFVVVTAIPVVSLWLVGYEY